MLDTSPESTFTMPLQLLSSANLHMFRALKLHFYSNDSRHQSLKLTDGQLELMRTTLANACPLIAGYKNMRMVECVSRQALMDTDTIYSV